MPLFTIIGLMIAVFGATYTAISSFRTHYNPIVSEYVKQAPDKVAQIRRLRGEADGALNEKYANRIRCGNRCWHWFSILPIGLFLIFSFGLSVWLFGHWDKITANFDSETCKLLTEINAALNFLSVLGAACSYLFLRSSNKVLTENYALAAKGSVRPANGTPPGTN